MTKSLTEEMALAEPVAWLVESGFGKEAFIHKGNADPIAKVQRGRVIPLYAHPAASQGGAGEDYKAWAEKWHRTCETMMTVLGLSCAGSPEEMLAELQDYLGKQIAPSRPATQPGEREDVPERETAWLIEREGPIYTSSRGVHPNWTTDPWRAERYKTAREADNARLSIGVDRYRDESAVIEHMFINKQPRRPRPGQRQ